LKTVVTGGAGFIGSHLVKKLLELGRETVVIDDFSMGSQANLDDLGISPEIRAIDARDYASLAPALSSASTVFHLAARIGNINYLHGSKANELQALQSNLVIDANVFRACRENNVKKIVYTSSSAVYPIDLQQQSKVVLSLDSMRYYNPEGGYGWAKLMGEIQLGWMTTTACGIARIFNCYGENMHLGDQPHAIPDLIGKAIRYPTGEFVVWGDGKQSRDFLYVTDCVEALIQLEEKAASPPLIVNVGSGQTVTVADLAEKITLTSGKNIPIVYDTNRPVGPYSRTADISQTKTKLGWSPQVSLAEGLKRTYAWVQSRYNKRRDTHYGR
jgi:nucleoside-diphosphate-sugar epimerase